MHIRESSLLKMCTTCLRRSLVSFQEGRGRGTSNGIFRSWRYFTCDSDCAVFVSLEKLRLYDKKEVNSSDETLFSRVKNKFVKSVANVFLLPGEQQPQDEKIIETKDSQMGHKLGEIVWVFMNEEDEKPNAGILKYIGRVPGHNGIFAGIKMVSTVQFTYWTSEVANHQVFAPVTWTKLYSALNCNLVL